MPDDRLDDLQQAAWGGFLTTHERLWRALEASLAEDGMSLAEYDVLIALDSAGKDGVRLTDLAARRLMTTGGFTRLADRLQRQGLIERRRSVADGRGFDALLTPAGRRRLRQARKRHLGDVRRLFTDPLTREDLTHLLDAWRRLDAAADDADAADC